MGDKAVVPHQTINIPDRMPVVYGNDQLNAAVKEFSNRGCIVLVNPAMTFTSSFRLALEMVFIDNTVNEYHNGSDIYSLDKGKTYTFHYRAANKIAGAANIEWLDSRVVKRETDEAQQVIYVEHKVAWQIRKPNGTMKKGESTGFYRYHEDKVRFEKQPGQVRSRRHFAEALAESNAKYRAIFDALDQMPRQLSREDMGRPFIVPCVIDEYSDLIGNDQEAKRMMLAARLGIAEQVFGTGASQTQPVQPTLPPAGAEIPQAEVAAEPKPTIVHPQIPKEQLLEEWGKMSPEQREKELKTLLQRKGETWPDMAGDFKKLPEDRQLNALLHFYTLPGEPPVLPWEKK